MDYNNTNTDVIVQFYSGKKYIASFFTFQNLEMIREENLKSEAFLNGKYFWTKNMLLIDNCSKKNITKVIDHLIIEGDFTTVFKKLL